MDDAATRQRVTNWRKGEVTDLLLKYAEGKVSPLSVALNQFAFTQEDVNEWMRGQGVRNEDIVARCFANLVQAGVFRSKAKARFYTVNAPSLREAKRQRGLSVAQGKQDRLAAQRERERIAAERLEAQQEQERLAAQREQERLEAQREQERIEAQQEQERLAQEALRSFAEKVALGHTFLFEEVLQHVAEHMAARGQEESVPDAESSEARVREILDSMTTNHPSSEGWGRFYKIGDDEYRRLAGGGEPPRETDEGFALEANLRDFLAANLDILGLGLTLHPGGVEFAAGGGFIDILTRDARGGFVVIELKASRGHEYAIGQITRYIAWVQENLAKGEDGEPAKPVRGVILTRRASESLRLAASMVPSVHLLEYALSITVRPTGEG